MRVPCRICHLFKLFLLNNLRILLIMRHHTLIFFASSLSMLGQSIRIPTHKVISPLLKVYLRGLYFSFLKAHPFFTQELVKLERQVIYAPLSYALQKSCTSAN